MGSMAFFEKWMDHRLKDLHCGYIGKVVSTDGETAKVQPLGLIQQYGSTETQKQAVIEDVPVACRYKIKTKTITYFDGSSTRSQVIAVPEEIKKGDLVACLCADRNITAARNGENELPPTGQHSISDSIIVGIL